MSSNDTILQREGDLDVEILDDSDMDSQENAFVFTFVALFFCLAKIGEEGDRRKRQERK